MSVSLAHRAESTVVLDRLPCVDVHIATPLLFEIYHGDGDKLATFELGPMLRRSYLPSPDINLNPYFYGWVKFFLSNKKVNLGVRLIYLCLFYLIMFIIALFVVKTIFVMHCFPLARQKL